MILLITSSGDGTSDLIVKRLIDVVFRLNFDQLFQYKILFSPGYWEIENPAGRKITSLNVSSVFWWKAFNAPPVVDDPYLIDESKYILREIYGYCVLKGMRKGNPPDFHNLFGKIQILEMASKYFKTPKTVFTINRNSDDLVSKQNRITKSLSSGAIIGQKVLFTTDISNKNIDEKYPWFIQEKIVSNFDMTCLVVENKIFTFVRSREKLKGLDWRAEQTLSIDVKEWDLIKTPDEFKNSILKLNNDLNVNWGRYDFMINNNDEFIFLEFNANGQWMFLDYSGSYGLLDVVVDYIKS